MWEELEEQQKQNYKELILAFASLTEVFSQKVKDEESYKESLVPAINSKFQEKAFQKVFSAHPEDINNTTFDVSLNLKKNGLNQKYFIGIKTFVYKNGKQKVAQIKSFHDQLNEFIIQTKQNADKTDGTKKAINTINKHLYLTLAKQISEIRNAKMKSSFYQITGYDKEKKEENYNFIYHVLMPCNKKGKPIIYVGETSYDLIDIDNITIIGCLEKPSNFSFYDGKHVYSFTPSDSQLWMNFEKKKIIKDTWNVVYINDAFSIFSDISKKLATKENAFESYSWFISKKEELPSYSGFNSFYSVGSKLDKKSRTKALNQLKEKIESYNLSTSIEYRSIYEAINTFFTMASKTKTDKAKKEVLRDSIVSKLKEIGNIDFEEYVRKLLFRPKSEVYIPIPHSKQFHTQHPDFFGNGYGIFKSRKSKKLKLPKDKRKFTLVFEPSGQKMQAYITQDNGKAIESVSKQSIMGEWLINDVFQLKQYEKLTRSKLEELNINGIRLSKNKETGEIHFSFIWIDENNKPDDFIV